MNYNSQNREIVVGQKYELVIPDDISKINQFTCSLPSINVIETYRKFKIPQDRDNLTKLLCYYGKIIYTEDVIAHVPHGGKHLEDNLICFLVELRNKLQNRGDFVQANEITEQLRSMGVVLMPRKDSALIWNAKGEVR